MCLMCVEFQKGRMNITEAKSNLRELILTAENLTEEESQHIHDLNWAEDMAEEMFKYKGDDDEDNG